MSGVPRRATAADIDAVLALEQSCFSDDPWTRNMLQEELGRAGGVFVALGDEGRPVAFAIGWSVLDELHVLQVAVDPAQRRGGLGRRIMEALEAGAGSAETAWLEVRRDNAAAIGMYEALGYRAVGCRQRYYTDGCDALLLRKTLKG
jgi:ribosomal-protein-alanine N-acetyltransferase